jgi:LysR family glycine cleavage system transcriptional activator
MAGRWLPPLTALRTFEAVARLGVAGAAAELNVTPAAISHQIRLLEAELEVPLFTRSKAGLSLNVAGRRYLSDVAAGFDTIFAGTRRLKNPEREDRLVVDSLTSFANDVIIPRLGRLYRRFPKFELQLNTLSRPFIPLDFGRTSAHAAIRGGGVAGQWRDLIAEKLAHEVFFPVCAPALMHGPLAIRSPADLANHPLIAVSSTPEGWPEWLAAAKAQGMDVHAIDTDQPIRFDTIHSATLAAMEGIGIDLGRSPLVDRVIDSGRLVAPFDLRVVSTHAYWLVYPESSRALPAFQTFRRWLFDELPALPAE